jgi:hypothetical protein
VCAYRREARHSPADVDHRWIGVPTYFGDNKWYDAVERRGIELRIDQTVAVKTEGALARVGEITYLWEDRFGKAWAGVRWYMRGGQRRRRLCQRVHRSEPEETVFGPRHETNELFKTSLKDDVPLESINHRVRVLSREKFCESDVNLEVRPMRTVNVLRGHSERFFLPVKGCTAGPRFEQLSSSQGLKNAAEHQAACTQTRGKNIGRQSTAKTDCY